MSIPSIARLPQDRPTLAPQVKDVEPSMLVQTAELRDSARDLVLRADSLHTDQQHAELARRATQLAQQDPSDLLRALSLEYGFSWPSLAKLVGVTTAAIRKWRRNSTMTPENRHKLASVIAFCELLARVNPLITDPALWLETPVMAETRLTHADIYAQGLQSALLDIASHRVSPAEVLDMAVPGWRAHQAPDTSFKVVTAGDGIPSVVPTGTDE